MMRTLLKKSLIVLMICLFNIIFSNFNVVEATTNGYTPDTAIEYVKSLLGTPIDIDNAGGNQCVDLIMQYEKTLSGVYYTRRWK